MLFRALSLRYAVALQFAYGLENNAIFKNISFSNVPCSINTDTIQLEKFDIPLLTTSTV